MHKTNKEDAKQVSRKHYVYVQISSIYISKFANIGYEGFGPWLHRESTLWKTV